MGMMFCSAILTTVWLVIPIVNNFIKGAFYSDGTVRYETCIYMIMPFDFEHDFWSWLAMHLIGTCVAYFGCTLLSLFDTIQMCIVSHLIGRIKILKHHFQDITENYEKYSDKDITKILGICVRDHVLIIQYFKEMEKSHGFSVTVNYAYNLICDALIILELNYGDFTTRTEYSVSAVIFIGGLFLMSSIMQEIRNQSDDLPVYLYDIPWEKMTRSNKKIFLVLLSRLQNIIVFKAFAGLEAGIKPAIRIVKTAFSYYVMLESKSVKD